MRWSLLFTASLLLACPADAKERTVIAKISHYCACKQCSGDFPGKVRGQTASGSMAKQGRTLAMPKGIPFGTQVFEDGKLLGVCEDRGGAIMEKEGYIRIDYYMDSHHDAANHRVRWSVVTIVPRKK